MVQDALVTRIQNMPVFVHKTLSTETKLVMYQTPVNSLNLKTSITMF